MVTGNTNESQHKKLYKVRSGKMLDGVCQGIAHYFHVDVTLVRVLFLVALFAQGLGALIYILAMIFVPVQPDDAIINDEEEKPKTALLVGAAFIIAGLFFLIRPFGHFLFWPIHFRGLYGWNYFSDGYFWPVLLILTGAGYIVYVLRKDQNETETESHEANSATHDNKWYRVQEGKILGGVLAGLAKLWGQDPALIRIGVIVLAWLTHPGIWVLAYAILYGVLPKANQAQS